MPSKKILLGLSLALAIAAIAVSSASLFAAKPSPTALKATYRDATDDAQKSGLGREYVDGVDGAAVYFASGGSYFWLAPGSQHFSYHLTMPASGLNNVACLVAGPTEFNVSGGGEIKVTPASVPLDQMGYSPSPSTQFGEATTRLSPGDGFHYHLRFNPGDTLLAEPDCSTRVTITRTDADHWDIEGFAHDVARLLKHPVTGPGGYTNLGHYFAPFKISLARK